MGGKRFEGDAKAATKPDHPNICAVHEIDRVDGRTYIAMAFREGRFLLARKRRTKQPPVSACRPSRSCRRMLPENGRSRPKVKKAASMSVLAGSALKSVVPHERKASARKPQLRISI